MATFLVSIVIGMVIGFTAATVENIIKKRKLKQNNPDSFDHRPWYK